MKNLFSFNNLLKAIIFLAVTLLLFLLYQYHHILFFRPQSIHAWRQTICTSVTLNYYQHGMHFLTPEVHLLFSDGGTTGQSQAEFPIQYYFNAMLWKIFGVHEFILRLVNIIICLMGAFYLFKLLDKLLSVSWAIMLTLLLFTSPVIAFYVNNFLVDIPILFICFISAYYFYNYYEKGKAKDIYLFMLVSLLCILLKPVGGTFFIAILCVFVLEKLKIVKFEKPIFSNYIRDGLLFAVVLLISVVWYAYAFRFNDIHGGRYIATFFPIWELTPEQINSVIKKFFELVFPQFLFPGTTFVFLFFLAGVIFFRGKIKKIHVVVTALLLLGGLAHAILWFQLWNVHDYYMFIFFLPVIFVFICFFSFLKNHYPDIFNSKKSKLLFAFFLLINIWYCSNNIRMRYGLPTTEIPFIASKGEIDLWKWNSYDYHNTTQAFETIEAYNRSVGIKPEDKVISIPDQSICITLYLMNQRGWTGYGLPYLEQDVIADKIKLGAKYLFLNDPALINNSFIYPYTKKQIGQYKNVSIYSLENVKPLTSLFKIDGMLLDNFTNSINEYSMIVSELNITHKYSRILIKSEFEYFTNDTIVLNLPIMVNSIKTSLTDNTDLVWSGIPLQKQVKDVPKINVWNKVSYSNSISMLDYKKPIDNFYFNYYWWNPKMIRYKIKNFNLEITGIE